MTHCSYLRSLCFEILGHYDTDEDLDFEVDLVLDRHPAGIACIAWSPDDSVLLTGADSTITMWNTRVGVLPRFLLYLIFAMSQYASETCPFILPCRTDGGLYCYNGQTCL